MSSLASFLTGVCAVCIIMGGLTILIPKRAMEKPVKFLLSLVFLVSVISLVFTLKNVNISIKSNSQIPADIQKLLVSAARLSFAKALENNNINFSEITVCTDKSDDNSIIITKVIIYTDSDRQEVLDALGEFDKNYEVIIQNE